MVAADSAEDESSKAQTNGEAQETAEKGVQYWLDLDPNERRDRAAAACRAADVPALCSLTEAYLTTRRGANSPVSRHTLRAYCQSIQVLLDHWTGEILLNPTPEAVAEFVDSLQQTGARLSTLSVRMAGVRALYHALQWAGVVDSDPFGDVHLPQGPVTERAARLPYTDAELTALLDMAGPQDRAVILLCARAGLRVSECVALTWNNVDLAAGTLTVPETEPRRPEGWRGRVVTLAPDLLEALQALPRLRSRVLSFTTDVRARQRMQQLCLRAGVRYRGLDALRLGSTAAYARNRPPRSGREADPTGRAGTNEATAIPDSRALKIELSRTMREAERTGKGFAVLTVDLDQFPGVEDTHAATVDHEILSAVAARISRVWRPYDFVAKRHDRGFAVVLKNVPPHLRPDALSQRLWDSIHAHPISVHGKRIPVTGIVRAGTKGEQLDRLVQEIDQGIQGARG